MNFPTWTTPGIYGAAVGAVALAVVGFSWGGWVTGTTAAKSAASETAAGIAAALTPYCVEKSKADPAATQILTDLKAASSYSRGGVVEKAGWATPLGSEKPNAELAKSCGEELVKTL